MKTGVIALTKNGSKTAIRVGTCLQADIFVKECFYENGIDNLFKIDNKFNIFIGNLFKNYDALVFVMACGIVVRSIAPYIVSKRTDPAVIVMDENAQNIISLLSGHIGGANGLTHKIAGITGGNPVITTATDVNNVIAFDLFANKNNFYIENFENLKYISSDLVNGLKIGFYTEFEIMGILPDNIVFSSQFDDENLNNWVVLSNRTDLKFDKKRVMYIRPKNLILGIGCKKGTAKIQIESAVNDFLEASKRSFESIKHISTVDLKMEEKGIIEFCEEHSLELKEVSREQIKSVEKEYRCSDFVRKNIGVGCVSEPCAVLGGNMTELVCKRKVYSGITLALAEERNEVLVIENNQWSINASKRGGNDEDLRIGSKS